MTEANKAALEWFQKLCNDESFKRETVGCHHYRQKQAIIKALQAPAVPDGWKLVPIEPTEEMDDAAHGKNSGRCSSSWCSCDCKKIYKAMLSAAPTYGE